MATITLTEILGGDNIAGSRVTINDNFKRTANAINTIETRLDTSFTPGGSLNVGNALILKYTNPTSAQIFTCEATGLFQGGLNVLLNLGVTQSADIGLDLAVHRNITLDGAATGGGSFLSTVRSTFAHETVNSQLYLPSAIAPAVDLQALAGSGAVRALPSVLNHSVLRIDATTFTSVAPNDCEGIILPAVGSAGCTPGQILTVIIDAPGTTAFPSGFSISATNLATALPIVLNAVTTSASANIRKNAVTLFADFAGWRVIGLTQAVANDITY